jgi:hypothetical protein
MMHIEIIIAGALKRTSSEALVAVWPFDNPKIQVHFQYTRR